MTGFSTSSSATTRPHNLKNYILDTITSSVEISSIVSSYQLEEEEEEEQQQQQQQQQQVLQHTASQVNQNGNGKRKSNSNSCSNIEL